MSDTIALKKAVEALKQARKEATNRIEASVKKVNSTRQEQKA